MRLRIVISLMLVFMLAIAVSAFAGGAGEKKAPETGEVVTDIFGVAVNLNPPFKSKNPNWKAATPATYAYDDMSKRYSISFGNTGWNAIPMSDPDPLKDFIEKRLNVNFSIQIDSADNLRETRMAAGDPYDLFITSTSLARKWAEEGLVWTGWKENAEKVPTLWQYYTDVDHAVRSLPNGQVFAVGVPPGSEWPYDFWRLWIRMDWLKKLGLSMPKTVEDVYTIAKAFTFNDPDGNGKDDTWAMTSFGGNQSLGWILAGINQLSCFQNCLRIDDHEGEHVALTAW